MMQVRLRRWRASDATEVAAMIEEEHIRRWSSMGDGLETWIEHEMAERRGPSRAVCLPDDDRVLGRVALRLPEFASVAVRCEAVRESDLPAGELSYWLLPEARGRGIALAAVRLMMSSIGRPTGLRSVVLDIEADNHPSARLAERLGAEARAPTRVEIDRTGVPRTFVVHVLAVG